jgi:hypothetical protein
VIGAQGGPVLLYAPQQGVTAAMRPCILVGGRQGGGVLFQMVGAEDFAAYGLGTGR